MININNLSFSYPKEEALFKSLDLNIGSGKICGLLGKNGAGKTTLLRHFLGLLFPDQGSVFVHGEVASKRDPDILKEIFYVQEEFELPSISIQLYVQLYSPFYPSFDRQKFYSLLDEFEVKSKGRMDKFSFGQKKKIQISFALATGVKLLIFDEPTNGLDIPSKAKFRKILISSLDEDQSIIISSHQVRDLSNLLDQVIILEDGQIILNEDVFDIASVLHFDQIKGTEIPQSTLYHEMIPGGYLVVMPNTGSSQSTIDLEALFNTVVTNKDAVISLFNQNKTNIQ